MGCITESVAQKRNTVMTLQSQLELIRSQIEVYEREMLAQVDQQEELLTKQETVSHSWDNGQLGGGGGEGGP